MILWLITFVALALAGAAALWALRLRREEEARRAVRVTALARAIDATNGPGVPGPSVRRAMPQDPSTSRFPGGPATPDAPPVPIEIDDDSPWFNTTPVHADRREVAPPRANVEPRAVVTPREIVNSSGAAAGLFAAQAPAATRSNFAPALALGALVLIATIAGATMLAGDDASADASATPAAATGSSPLELVSLVDRTEKGVVTISGLVRNPRANAAIERLTAVVFFFDAGGGFLASARMPVDFPHLAPGEESPFVVTAPAPSGASRFRVSFRADGGGIIPHVDRRGGR